MIAARAVGRRFGEKRVLRGVELDLPRGGFAVVTRKDGITTPDPLTLKALGLTVPPTQQAPKP